MNAPSAQKLQSLTLDRQVCTLRLSPDGHLLAAGSYMGDVLRWTCNGDEFQSLDSITGHDGWVQAIAFSLDGARLISADTWGRLRCHSEPSGKPALAWEHEQAHDGWIRKLAVSPDGQTLASCGRDGFIRLWAVADGSPIRELRADGEDTFSLAFHPDGRSLVAGDLRGVIRQWDLHDGREIRTFDARVMYLLDRIQDVGGVRDLVFTQGGKVLVAAGAKPDSGGFVQAIPVVMFFDWDSGKEVRTVELGASKDGYVYEVLEHPSGFLMAVTSGQPGNGQLLFLDPGEGAILFQDTKLVNAHSQAFDVQRQRLLIAATNASSAGNGRPLKDGEYPANTSPIHVWEVTA